MVTECCGSNFSFEWCLLDEEDQTDGIMFFSHGVLSCHAIYFNQMGGKGNVLLLFQFLLGAN